MSDYLPVTQATTTAPPTELVSEIDRVAGLSTPKETPTEDSPVAEKEAAPEEAATSEAPTEEPQTEEPPKEEKPPVRTILAKAGEAEIQIPEDAIIEVKVDGKVQTVRFRDLEQNFQGKIPWERHYRELKQEKRTFEAEKQADWEKVKAAADLASSDPFKALQSLSLIMGKDPAEFLPKYLEQAEVTIKHLSDLDENQRQAVLYAKKLELQQEKLKAQEEKLTHKEQQAKEEQEVSKYIVEQTHSRNISDGEFHASYQVLEQLADSGQVSIENLSPKQVTDLVIGHIVAFARPMHRLSTLIAKVDPKLALDSQFKNELYDLTHKTNFTDEELIDIIRTSSGTTLEEPQSQPSGLDASLNGNGRPNRPNPRPTKANPQTKAEEDLDPLSMDEILDFYKKKTK